MSILCWLVVAGIFKVVGKILLSSYMMRMVVSVEVTLAVPQRLCPRVVSVTQMLGHRSPASLPNICQRPINGQVRGVRLGCRRHRNNSLREKQAGLGHSNKSNALRDGHTRGQHLGRSHTNLFRSGDHNTSRDETRILPRLNHPR